MSKRCFCLTLLVFAFGWLICPPPQTNTCCNHSQTEDSYCLIHCQPTATQAKIHLEPLTTAIFLAKIEVIPTLTLCHNISPSNFSPGNNYLFEAKNHPHSGPPDFLA